MVIKGQSNSFLHMVKDVDNDKYIVIVTKEESKGLIKSVKIIADNVHTFSENNHSIQISEAHYAICPDMDFFPMASRISKSRSYRRHHDRMQEVA